jgi:serine protease
MRRATLHGLAGLTALTISLMTPVAAGASADVSAKANPHAPAVAHPYRHGVLPTVQAQRESKTRLGAHSGISRDSSPATSEDTLAYGGGIDGIGVMSGKAQVYLIFWGSQWGAQSTDSTGDLTFSNDPDGAAPVAQNLFKDIGTGGEQWSATLTQWCDGPLVAAGAVSCPSNANFVPYMSGGVLSGVWYDNAAAEPDPATGHQLGLEALAAAHHFGNTTPASNRHAYYVVLSATGLNPDNYQNAFCAWHDYNGDDTLDGGAIASDVGDFAFSNQPYTMDMGTECGVGFINDPGTLDGWTMALGHEFAETVSDQNPAGGWTNLQQNSSAFGEENADECAWIPPFPGDNGTSGNVTMGTGTFAMQPTWSNDDNQCDLAHPVVSHVETVSVTSPGNRTDTVNTPIKPLQVVATDSAAGKTLTFSATGLPPGLSISSSGLISGTPTKTGTSSVTVRVTSGTASGSAAGTWTVATAFTNGIQNGGFETGTFRGWTTTGTAAVNSGDARTGTYDALLGDPSNPTDGDSTAAQTFTVPAGKNLLSFWYNPTCLGAVDSEWTAATLTDNTTHISGMMLPDVCGGFIADWTEVATSVIAGHNYTLTLISHDDNNSTDPTAAEFDDVALAVAGPNPIVNGGFETGNLSGWTASGAAESVVNTAHSGNDAARLGDLTVTDGDSSIAQTFTAAAGDSMLSFWYSITCPGSIFYDWATATLTDNTTQTDTILLYDCPATSTWSMASSPITPGDSYTLTLTSHDDVFDTESTYTLYDDVIVN